MSAGLAIESCESSLANTNSSSPVFVEGTSGDTRSSRSESSKAEDAVADVGGRVVDFHLSVTDRGDQDTNVVGVEGVPGVADTAGFSGIGEGIGCTELADVRGGNVDGPIVSTKAGGLVGVGGGVGWARSAGPVGPAEVGNAVALVGVPDLVDSTSVFTSVGEGLELLGDVGADAGELVVGGEGPDWASRAFLSEEVGVDVADA